MKKSALHRTNGVVVAVLAVVLVVGASTLGACGGATGDDDDNGGGGGFDSGKSDSKAISDLSSSDRVDMCKSAVDHLSNELPMSRFCIPVAHSLVAENSAPQTDSEAQAVCDEQKTACLEQFSDQHAFEQLVSCADPGGDNCGAQVSLYESCVDGYVGSYQEVFENVPSCDEVTADFYSNYDSSTYDNINPRACQDLETECPGTSL